MNNVWKTTFIEPLKEFMMYVAGVFPHIVVMMVVVTAGILVAWVLRSVLFRFLVAIKFDQVFNRMGLTQTLAKGGIRETASYLVSRVVYWFVVLIFLMFGLGTLKLAQVDQFVANVLSYLPNILVAIIILMMGILLGNFFARAMLIAAVNAQISQARLMARLVRLTCILFALAMAFEQLGIAETVIIVAFSITFGGVVLALAIAFGLGARDTAKALIEKRFKKEPEKKEEDLSHL